MWEEEEFSFLKNRFTFSVYDICTTKVSTNEEAFVNPMGSLIEQMDLFEYSSEDINRSMDILDELLNKIAVDKRAYSVLGCGINCDSDVIGEVRHDIYNMFYKLQKNCDDIASSKDENKRKVEYQRLLKGFRVIAQVLNESLLPLDVVAANIATIREASKHCMSNWKFTLIGLMINCRLHIERLLGGKGIVIQKKRFINNEEDRIYDLLLNAFYVAKNSVTSDLISKFIKKVQVFEGGETHYSDVCINFLNKEYNLNLPQLNDVSENFLSSGMVANIESAFKEYIQARNIQDMIFDKAMKNCIEEIEKCPQKINQIMDWFYMYLKDKGIRDMAQNVARVYEFIDRYITCGKYNCRLRYAALKEMMVYYGFISVRVQNRISFKENRIIQKLLDIDKNNIRDKMKFKMDVIGVLGEELDLLIKFMSHPVVMTYELFDKDDIVRIFVDKTNYDRWLLLAGMFGNEDITRHLVENGADINVADNSGFTVFMYACESGNKNILRYLLECGVDISKEDEHGNTALTVAISKNYCDIVTYLLERGADVNKKDSLGWSPIIIASNNNNVELVVKLIEYGVDVNAIGEEDCTALMYACYRNNIDMVRHLVNAGADVNVHNENEYTALMLACEKNNTNLVMYLVEYGANVNYISSNGNTALGIACKNNNITLMNYLVENFASISVLSREYRFKINLLLCNSKNFKANISIDIQHSIQSRDIDKLTKCLNNYMIGVVCNEEVKLWEMVNCMNYLDGNRLDGAFSKVVHAFKKCIYEYIKRRILNNVPLNRKRSKSEEEHRKDKCIKLK